MLEWEGTITHIQECLIKLCQVHIPNFNFENSKKIFTFLLLLAMRRETNKQMSSVIFDFMIHQVALES